METLADINFIGIEKLALLLAVHLESEKPVDLETV